MIVAIGLVLATRSALSSWRAEQTRAEEAIERLGEQIAETRDSVLRNELKNEQDRLRQQLPTLGNIDWQRVSLGGVFYLLGLLPTANVLGLWLGVFGHRPPFALVLASQTLGHVGKYVPGKALVVVLRVSVLRRANVPVIAATVSVFLETFLMMAVGASVAAVVICFLPVPRWMIAASIVGAILAALPTLPPVLQQITNRLMGRELRLGRTAWSACGKGWLWMILSWSLIGSSFAMIVSAIPEHEHAVAPERLWAISTAAIALAMVIGFASLLPGGAGVRELVLTTILGLAVGPMVALLAAILARIVFIVVECVAALAAYMSVRTTSVR